MRSKKPAMNVKKTALGLYSASQPSIDAKKAQVSYPSRFLYTQTIFLQLFKNRKKFVIPFPIQNFAYAPSKLSLAPKACIIRSAMKNANSLRLQSFL